MPRPPGGDRAVSQQTMASSRRDACPAPHATTCGFIGMSVRVPRSSISLAPVAHAAPAPFRGTSRFCLRSEQRQQGSQRGAAIADQADFHGVAQADALRIEVDLHAARLSRFGHELDIRKRGADDQQRVAFFHRFLRRLGAQQPDAARGIRAVIGHRGLAKQRLDDRRAELLGQLLSSSVAHQRTRPGQDGDLLPAFRISAALPQIRRGRAAARYAPRRRTCDAERCASTRCSRFTSFSWKSAGKVIWATPRYRSPCGRPGRPCFRRASAP